MQQQCIQLADALKVDFPWQKQRLTFLAMALLSIISARTVNLARLATVFASGVLPESNYKRLQRFFRGFEVSQEQILRFIVRHLPQGNGSWVLLMDRTNWKLGRCSINLLVVAVARDHVALPIYWTCLTQAGASNTDQRIAAIDALLKVIDPRKIAYLLADREFIGEDWFAYLIKKKIDFSIRVRENLTVTGANARTMLLSRLFASLSKGASTTLRHARTICGCRLYLAARRNEKGELLIVVAPRYAHHAIQQYRQRWQIETLFGCLKTRGFNLEDTHMTKPERLEKLFALLTIAAAWALAVGEWVDEQEKPAVKSHGRRAVSSFRRGLDWIISTLFNFHRRGDEFRHVLSLLSCT